ncbi:hypothetical protein [Actinomadura coerulea]|uniref:hypothetical protein n=1 Tax=Actinomadura coerulea TaxID=46159 RepID=UPI003437A61C
MTESTQAPHRRVVDAEYGPWMRREPSGPEEEAMAPGYAAWRAEVERQRAVEPDPSQWRFPPLRADQVVYVHGYTRQVLPLAEVEARYGPVRPVLVPDSADVERLQDLVRAAGRRALGTIAAALYAVEQRIMGTEPPQPPSSGLGPDEGQLRRDPLTAGRPGSREAVDLIDVVWTIGPTVSSEGIHTDLHREAVEMFFRWATGPQKYVEFAETLPEALAVVVDERGGVAAIAEDWLLVEQAAVWAGSKSGHHADC